MRTLRLLVLSLCLMGCTHTLSFQDFPKPPPKIWTTDFYRLNRIKTWTSNGKISIDRRDNTTFGSFKWQQARHSYRIKIYPPFGTDFIQIIGTYHRATLIHNKHRLTRANPERLMQDEIGWHLPISGLYYWIRGIPMPTTQARMIFKTNGLLASLHQGHWTVHYMSYTRHGRFYLPKKIILIRPGLRIKIIIKHWKL